MAALKRLKVREESERITWRNPRFSDWKLTWNSDFQPEETTWSVHRNVLIGGSRACFFFDGAARECAYDTQCTEMSKLLPEACKGQMERVLDFIYGEPLGDCASHDMMPLLKIADVLQCPTLQNMVIEMMERGIDTPGNVEVYLVEVRKFDLPTIAEALVNLIPLRQLTGLNFDLFDVENGALMRTLAQRLSLAKMTQWGRFLGHGEVNDSSVAIIHKEKNRKCSQCHARSLGSMLVGCQTWKFRIDHVPPPSDEWDISVAVVSGSSPDISTTDIEGYYFISEYNAYAFLTLYGEHNGDQYKWVAGAKRAHEDVRFDVRPGILQQVRSGDIVSLKAKFSDLSACGDVEWLLNDVQICCIQGQLSAAPLSVCLELMKWDYEVQAIGATLIDHTVNCKGNYVGHASET